jgi:hypothetical protein
MIFMTFVFVSTVGLTAKKCAPYAKDSVDFVLTVQDEDDEDELVAWGFEAKGRVTASSAAEEERNLRLMADPNIRVNDNEVYEVVADQGERFQVLQHAYVYDFKTVVLAISDNQSDLIRSTTIDFSTQLKEDFAEVLKDLMSFSLYWAYPNEEGNNDTNGGARNRRRRANVLNVPDNILSIAKSIPTINGSETLQGTANIWYSLTQMPKPYPSLLRIIPAIYAFWNSVKGGSDTATKLMDDCILRIPKSHLNAETVAVNRLISLLLVVSHRLFQVITAQENINSYPSLAHYRKAASERSTFHVSLLNCKDVCLQELERLSTHHNEAQPSHPLSPRSCRQLPSRRNPTRVRIAGVIPEPTSFGAILPTITPKKINRIASKGNDTTIQQMVEKCTGIPMKAHPRKQQRCANCKFKTPYYCAGCKRWLCMERKATKDNSKEFGLYSHMVKGEHVTFQKLCFHKCHEAAWSSIPATDTSNNNNENNVNNGNVIMMTP